MKLVDEVPQKEAIVHLLRGKVVEEQYKLTVGDVVLSPWLVGKLKRRCEGYLSLQDGIEDKDIYLRGRKTDYGVHWFGLVSDQFRPMSVERVGNTIGEIAQKEFVRYDQALERFQIGYVVKDSAAKVMVYVDSGDFGVYGGNGESALHYGVAIMDGNPHSWALFQNKRQINNDKRVIHRVSFKSLEKIAQMHQQFIQNIESLWEQNIKRDYTREEVSVFASTYIQRCEQVFQNILTGMNGGIKGYELIGRMQEEAVRLSGRTQLGIEALMGDIGRYR